MAAETSYITMVCTRPVPAGGHFEETQNGCGVIGLCGQSNDHTISKCYVHFLLANFLAYVACDNARWSTMQKCMHANSSARKILSNGDDDSNAVMNACENRTSSLCFTGI